MVNALYKLYLKLIHVKYGKRLSLKGLPFIYNRKGASITIGDNCVIKSSFLSNLIGLYSRTILLTRLPGAVIEIGDNVGISGATIYARIRIVIGSNTNIGGNVKILDNDFHPVDPCFIGCNVLILKGSRIGNNCVVGAGAVVSGSFEDNCVIAGNPAKIIKRV